jgi:imidazolonepropionase
LHCDRLWTHVHIATCPTDAAGLGIIRDGAIAAKDGRIVWCGARTAMGAINATETIDCGGRWMTPGLIDCHTHLIFAGDRSDEFARRLAGETYADIARAGGGIVASMRATRAADPAVLYDAASHRLAAWEAEGVTTVEIKSGYGLDADTEFAVLRTARALGATGRMRVAATYLGAHAMPPDRARADYLDLVCDHMIPLIAHEDLADAVDGFCETIAFTPAEIERVFTAAKAHGLAVKLHADQLTDGGGAALAAHYGAISADHLEYASESGIAAMAARGTVAVVLPGAYYVLREPTAPPVAAMRRAGCAIAVGTDCNPGTSPIMSLRLSAHMACVLFGLTFDEAWRGITINAARALGIASETGSIVEGKSCDLAIWSVDSLAEVLAWIGPAPLYRRILKGNDL